MCSADTSLLHARIQKILPNRVMTKCNSPHDRNIQFSETDFVNFDFLCYVFSSPSKYSSLCINPLQDLSCCATYTSVFALEVSPCLN